MIQFFIKHKKVRGAITIFLTIIYMAMYLLVGVFVDGGRLRMAQTMMEDVQQIATENVMSQYNRGLYEYYGLLGLNEELDDITKDVKNQIEQSIGLNIPEDTVKSFIEDIWVAGNSVVNNIGILKSTNSVINKVKDLKSAIDDDIVDYSKRFDPYGLKNLTATISYIDLTNTEALRAQIRDEMRYSAPLVLAANFSKAAEEFLNVSRRVDALKDITHKVASESEIIEKQSEYYKSINGFATTFDDFVQSSYNGTGICERIESAFNNITSDIENSLVSLANKVTETAKSILKDIKTGFLSLFKKETSHDSKDVKNESDENKGLLDIPTSMLGYAKVVIGGDSLVLYNYATEFDTDTWADGNAYILDDIIGYETVEEEDGSTHEEPIIDEYYHETLSDCESIENEHSESDCHRHNLETITDSKYSSYDNKINGLKEKCNKAIEKAEVTLNLVKEVLQLINKLEGELKIEYDKNVDDEEIKKMYDDSMETYLRQWNKLYDEKETIENFRDDLITLKTLIDEADIIAQTKKDEIKGIPSLGEGWTSPYASSGVKTLLDEQQNIRNTYHDILKKLEIDEKGIKNFNDHAQSDGVKADVFALLNYVVNIKKSDEGADVKIEDDDTIFGKMKKCEKSNNALYDPYAEIVNDDMDEDNIISKVLAIFDQAQKIVSAIPTELAGNIYDETYILTHCRDYVHTYRYRNLLKKGEIDENDKDIDTVLNPKFVKDQHDTKYLSNTQLGEYEVTPAEIEYILWGQGKEGDKVDTSANVTIMYANIFIIRLALDYIAAFTSPKCKAESISLSALAGPFAGAVRFAAPLIYALPQSIIDTKGIMYDCKKVSIYNGGKDLDLWDAVTGLVNEIKDDATETFNNMANNLINNVNEQLKEGKLSTSIICGMVVDKSKNHSSYQEVKDAALHLLSEIASGIFVDSECKTVTIENTTTKIDKTPKAGYSDYLLIYLFLRGINKESQISNLMDVIETNMRKAQNDDFRLSKTYSQIGVETECDIKYIFMTQSIMRKYFNNASSYDKATLKTRTSFAY